MGKSNLGGYLNGGEMERQWPKEVFARIRNARLDTYMDAIGMNLYFKNVRKTENLVRAILKRAEIVFQKLAKAVHDMVVQLSKCNNAIHRAALGVRTPL